MESGKTNPHVDIGPRVAPDDPESQPDEEAAQTVSAPGSDARSPLQIPRKAWLKILKRVYTMWGFHNLSLLGAGMAFFTFLAITPLLAATVMIYGLIGDVSTVQRQMRSIYEVLPADAARIVESQMMAAVTTSSGVTGIALVVALVFAIYGGMRAANGFIGALNVINEEHESRNIIRLTLRVLLLTIAAIGIAITGVVSGGAFAWLQRHSQEVLGPGAAHAFQLLAWAAAIFLGSFGFAMMMRYGPDRRPARWRWLAPGALCATLIWLAISFGFSFYVSYISDYNATYGSLSAIVVFLMWLFLSAYGVLFGALLNAEVERHTSIDSTIGPDQPRGQRGAVLADISEGELTIEQWLEQTQRRAIARQIRRRG
ncbi:YihY/virulence factor BrkB family protein [Croceicoccus mobilis]|uniref:Uncharacterized protein n=1 Tax=Croceicoccus mobilis TaxID=1703339 RepID=A0A916Z866_9SPHN|nr:YihY/virulence factor BrkB family protein [Croceicoccus mobilis]GGD81077.1 hypothetical protein GCM10010990_33770 [Croceicoccus mobilis]